MFYLTCRRVPGPPAFQCETLKSWKWACNPDKPQEKLKILYLPYIRNTSEEIERECRKLGVKAVFKSYGTLRQALMEVKTPREDLEKKDVVYEVPCMDCDTSYIGETGRDLKK